ncbi:hypothetical protein [Rhodococcus sp. 11-3]|uniref:hypothetical protein n=1 Tax=Rhodococcus sp. 11-3 TaxID=2854796 RepID=UPI00203E05FF|nr:hypothetical protein [Rhodococcus sp. 11-3]USC17010.1 hypothetical protein KZJ41_09150 [Rhodococcus sp. 11-3]
MRFFEKMLKVAADETLNGSIVLMPFCVVAPEDQSLDFKRALDELHKRKIDMAQEVIVVTDSTGYVGDSTRGEIAYAEDTCKPVRVARVA